MEGKFGLIGFPLTHSFSKNFFAEKFKKEGIENCSYELYPIPAISELPALIGIEPNLKGLNVTIPYKVSVIPYLKELDDVAQSCGAVNTIKIKSGEMSGFNTDVYGFRQSVKPFLESHHQRALILGTGGSSKAVEFVLKELGIDYYFVSRDQNPGIKNLFLYRDLNKFIIENFFFIINTTPLGMFPETGSFPALPYEFMGSKHFLYDLVYNPSETMFLQKGKQKGAKTMNGLDMLKLQAEKSWQIWNGK